MEKRSLQSGNTFFPAIERRLTGSLAASAFWNCALSKGAWNREPGTGWWRKTFPDWQYAGDFFVEIFCRNKAQTFFPYPAIPTIIYKDCASPVQ
jgi:hypothetical protein